MEACASPWPVAAPATRYPSQHFARRAPCIAALRRAIEDAQGTLSGVIDKARQWEKLRDVPLNERQRLVINRMLEATSSGYRERGRFEIPDTGHMSWAPGGQRRSILRTKSGHTARVRQREATNADHTNIS